MKTPLAALVNDSAYDGVSVPTPAVSGEVSYGSTPVRSRPIRHAHSSLGQFIHRSSVSCSSAFGTAGLYLCRHADRAA
jgi:hypothetical protein